MEAKKKSKNRNLVFSQDDSEPKAYARACVLRVWVYKLRAWSREGKGGRDPKAQMWLV